MKIPTLSSVHENLLLPVNNPIGTDTTSNHNNYSWSPALYPHKHGICDIITFVIIFRM